MNRFAAVNVWRMAGIMLVCAFVTFAGQLDAQRPGGRGGRGRMDPERMREMMKERAEEQYREMCETLNLDDGQKEQADTLFKAMQKENDDTFASIQDRKLDPRAAMGKIRESNEKFMDNFAKLLNDEQKERFELIKKEMQERMDERRRRRN